MRALAMAPGIDVSSLERLGSVFWGLGLSFNLFFYYKNKKTGKEHLKALTSGYQHKISLEYSAGTIY